MKHDEDELLNKANDFQHDYSIDNHAHEAIRIYMSEYAEHLDRWRPITERPEIDSFVVMIDPSDKTLHPLIAKWTYLKDSCADMGNYDGWQWKPVTMLDSVA